MAGAGAPPERVPARPPFRVQSASVAISATVLALVVALAVSLIASAGEGPSTRAQVASRAASTTDAADPSAPPHAVAPPGRSGGPVGVVDARGAGAAGAQPAATGADLDGGVASPGGEPTASPASPSTVTSAGAEGAPAAPRRFELRHARPGEWSARATITEGTTLVGPRESAVEARYRVGPSTSGAQRVDAPYLMITSELVRYDGPGRRAFELLVATGGRAPLRFRSAAGFVDVPVAEPDGAVWTWSATSDDRRTSLDATLRLVGAGTRTVGATGRSVDVVEYTVDISLGGDHSMRIARHVWFAPELGLPLVVDERVNGTDGAGSAVDRRVVVELERDEPLDPAAAG
ncbi:MAG TPA: hypothetical protein VM345_19935 [Acidimicrobiales bacterium]|nr:hypothetical protein [Acidimicrobiales bacterium]